MHEHERPMRVSGALSGQRRQPYARCAPPDPVGTRYPELDALADAVVAATVRRINAGVRDDVTHRYAGQYTLERVIELLQRLV